ncbi:probable cytochrome P450 9f2 isoform X3 [Maniola jurtina]|uniref:probable cytochrome P450 9f2 isoform X3 n=1 Tax=Maniola jurtina TaxID=191418 RepID=UPI001E6864A5|nr:probable cytochrome P450 9f2 isoform X3 [Maniola jurtina]
MIVEIIVTLLTALLAYIVYVYKWVHHYYDKRGVKYLPGVPIFGNILKSTFLRKHLVDDLDTLYRAFPDEKYVGYIEGTAPILLIRDLELMKSITIKDFDHFVNHKQFFSEEIEPLFGGSLFMMKGERWHDMRTTLSPAFTGSKMKKMLPFMTEISANIVNHLKGRIGEDIDVEDLIRRYTSDVIASAAFGLQVDSVRDKDNDFYKTGQLLFKFNFWQQFMFFFTAMFPNLSKRLGARVFPAKTMEFFSHLVSSTMEYREKNNIERPDMIQLLMEASKGALKDDNDASDNTSPTDDTFKPKAVQRQWTQTELAGQVFIFFVAGYESSATALVMCVHELTINPDVQETLYQEIRSFKEKHGELTYDNLTALKYLDCVLCETQRKWAAALIMDRVCTKPYELPPPREGGKPVQLNKGDIVFNLVNSIHMDPQYHPNPTKFNPDRFSEENKHNIKPFTYMPFGMGPRNCIGSRFALMELKVLIYDLVLNFKFVKCAKTMDPIELKPHPFNIQPKNGSWIRLEPRTAVADR